MAKNTPANTPAAEAATTPRAAVTATGAALIALLADNGGSMFLTQAEGNDLIAAGHASVDTSNVEGDTAYVTLTDAGRAELDKANGAAQDTANAAQATGSAGVDIDDGVPIPTEAATRRGRSGGYPFDKLNVGQSFHIPKKDANDDPASRLASSVSGARAKYSTPIEGETEAVKVKVYKRGEDGKSYVKDAEGKRVVESETEESRPKMKIGRDFTVKNVDASDPKGEGARVWRIA